MKQLSIQQIDEIEKKLNKKAGSIAKVLSKGGSVEIKKTKDGIIVLEVNKKIIK